MTVELQAVKGSRSIVQFIALNSAKQINIRKTPEINHYEYCRNVGDLRIVDIEDLKLFQNQKGCCSNTFMETMNAK